MGLRGLYLDSGGKRMGWAVLSGDGITAPEYLASGVYGLEKYPDEKYHEYRLRLEQFWTYRTPKLLDEWQPDRVVNELLPITGFGNVAQALQASACISVVHAMCFQREVPVAQIAASTVKANVGGNGRATKVGVRNGVIELLPELAPRRVDWIKDQTHDESDAIAIGLCDLGYAIPKKAKKHKNG